MDSIEYSLAERGDIRRIGGLVVTAIATGVGYLIVRRAFPGDVVTAQRRFRQRGRLFGLAGWH